MALRGHVFGVTPLHNTLTQNTRQEQGDVHESVDVNTMNGTCLDNMGTKLRKNGNWMDEDLDATMLAVDDRVPIK